MLLNDTPNDTPQIAQGQASIEEMSNGFFAIGGDENGWTCQFVQSLFIPKDSQHLGHGGINKISDGVCSVPGWCGHGSVFTYDPKKDVWNEIDFSKKHTT